MGNELSLEEMSVSQSSLLKFRADVKRSDFATVIVKNYHTGHIERFDCKFSIGHSQYLNAHMLNISIYWPTKDEAYLYSNYDCAYVQMKYVSKGYILINSKNRAGEPIEIEVIVAI